MPSLFQIRPALGVDPSGLKNMLQLVQLRWFAVAGQLVTILTVHFGFGIHLPLDRMLHAVLFLVVFNILCLLHWRDGRPVSDKQLFIALLFDVATLTLLLFLSGGAENPFIFLYLLQVILGAVLLNPLYSWSLVGVTGACFTLLTQFNHPLEVPLEPGAGLGDPYTQGVLICFGLIASLLVVCISRIQDNLRARDGRLASLRQRAAEEEHIVRMGLLASGAAHELGTPLATLSVILGDWQRMAPFTTDPELMQDVTEMQTQLARCKSIVTGILQSAGDPRGEAPRATSVGEFLDDLVADWRATRATTVLAYANIFGDDLPIVADPALKQTIHNVLDNALEASPRAVALTAARDADRLVLTVTDEGPGFAPGMLDTLGKPYQSTKPRPGAGLGLFLVMNVARTLGGGVTARNRPAGGAEVVLTLPLAAIQLEVPSTDGHA